MTRAGRALQVWAWVTTVGLFLVVLIGFLDTFTGSARGCGASWPLCDGQILPRPTLHSLIEYGHRVLSAIVGLMVAGVTIAAWRHYPRRWEVRLTGAVGLGFVIVQAGVGALAVIWPETPPVMALHFGFAILALMGQALLAVVCDQLAYPASSGWFLRRQAPPPAVRRLATGAVAYALAVGYLGAYVAHAGAEAACQGWPLCNGAVLPPSLSGPVLLAFGHRLAALLLGGLVAWLYAATRALRPTRPDLSRGAGAALGCVAAQIASGAALVWTHASTPAEMVHVTLLGPLFAVLGYVWLQAQPRPNAPQSGKAVTVP